MESEYVKPPHIENYVVNPRDAKGLPYAFRAVRQVTFTAVDVVEGAGTFDDPARLVTHYCDDHGQVVVIEDPVTDRA